MPAPSDDEIRIAALVLLYLPQHDVSPGLPLATLSACVGFPSAATFGALTLLHARGYADRFVPRRRGSDPGRKQQAKGLSEREHWYRKIHPEDAGDDLLQALKPAGWKKRHQNRRRGPTARLITLDDCIELGRSLSLQEPAITARLDDLFTFGQISNWRSSGGCLPACDAALDRSINVFDHIAKNAKNYRGAPGDRASATIIAQRLREDKKTMTTPPCYDSEVVLFSEEGTPAITPTLDTEPSVLDETDRHFIDLIVGRFISVHLL